MAKQQEWEEDKNVERRDLADISGFSVDGSDEKEA